MCIRASNKNGISVLLSKCRCKFIINTPVRRYMLISMENTDLGLTVKDLRKTKGMSRMELANSAGISESYLKKIENGDRNPGLDIYQKIMDV
ncbi:MAG: helix-turn-helix transcriptional regulator [Muribaculaceae bacterium]|nr:helix-turn-helix transcriptional regulator [Muribaculaceae bacterium]